jgi:hypothetical protein
MVRAQAAADARAVEEQLADEIAEREARRRTRFNSGGGGVGGGGKRRNSKGANTSS